MTYNEFIQNIIDTRGNFGIGPDEYKERHHIIPKCLGGTNSNDNLIDLYAREHFIAHKLLFLENKENSSLCCAYAMMCFTRTDDKKEELTPEEYEELRIAFAKQSSERMIGNQINKGKIHTDEWKQKMSERNSGENNPFYGCKQTDEAREKIHIKMQERWSRPEEIQKCKERNSGERNPGYGMHWYNNGIENFRGFDCPDGYVSGKLNYKKRECTISNDARKKMSESKLGKHLYTNGTINIYAYECPEGFWQGSCKQKKHWYTNGIINVQKEECPEGFWPGRINS